MISFPFGKEQSGALIIAAFFLYAASAPDSSTLKLWVSFAVSSFAMLYAVLHGFLHSDRWAAYLDLFGRAGKDDIQITAPHWIEALFMALTLLLFVPLIVAIITVSGAYALAAIFFHSDVAGSAERLVFAIFQVLMLATAICGAPEFFAQFGTRDADGVLKSKLFRAYAGWNKDIRLLICITIGALIMAAAVSGDALLKTL